MKAFAARRAGGGAGDPRERDVPSTKDVDRLACLRPLVIHGQAPNRHCRQRQR